MWVDLPSGAKAELLSPDQLKAKHTRAVTRAISGGDRVLGQMIDDLHAGTLAAVIQAWTCTGDDGEILPIPAVQLSSLDELSAYDYDVLLNHDATAEVQRRYMELRTERVSPDDHADPESPTAPSDASEPALRAELSPRTKTAGPSGTRSRSTSRSLTAGTTPPTK